MEEELERLKSENAILREQIQYLSSKLAQLEEKHLMQQIIWN